MMEAITRDDDQSCHALNAAWMMKTAKRTMASARLAWAGGSPRGFHDMKTRIEPMRRTEPKPLKKYEKMVVKRWVDGGLGLFGPVISRS